MGRVIHNIPAFIIVLAMALTSVGPLLDHHFAERQPMHLHLGADGYTEHVHAYESNAHVHLQNSVETDKDYPIVFYNYDAGQLSVTANLIADTAMDSFLQYRPTSAFNLPSTSSELVKNNYIPPPGKPPKQLC